MSFISPKTGSGRAIPLGAIVLLALAIHGPLLLMQLPQSSYDANTHMFFASHYASHWFDPWNVKWYGGFSQTTYPPLVHQWIALFSHVMGITMAYMFVQLCTILLLVVGMYRYARLWVDERVASYAAIGSVFLGSLAMLVYQSGQLPTTCSAALTLNALPYFYEWATRSRFGSFIKGILIALAAAAAHHVTFLFGMILFALPVLWLAILDRRRGSADTSAGAVVVRSAIFAILAIVGVGLVLLPYWIALLQNPIKQTPIPHGSRDNYILNPASGMNFWIIPMGALLLAFPFIFFKGASERRLRPLLVGWFVTLLLGLGGTTPVPRFLLGRAYEILTFERFTFWQTLMALPIVALLAAAIMDRYQRRGAVVLWVLAAFTCSMAVAWTVFRPITASPFQIDPVVTFLNRDDHSKFRYLTLGFGTQFSRVSMLAHADSIDGNYHSARTLPEMTQYGSGDLDASKYFGTAGMESLRAILKHASKYGVKYAFVRDRYYEPLLAFAGWRQAEVYDNGNITLWTKDDVPPAQPVESPYRPAPWIGLWWGIFPIASSILAIIFVLMIPDRRPVAETVEFPAEAGEPVVLREAQ